jgi:hypothetical protein
MSQDIQAVKDEIGFLRALVEERDASMQQEGAVLAAAGIVFGLTTLAYGLKFSGLLALPAAWEQVPWIGGALVFVGALAVIQRRVPRSPGVGARVMRAAWSGVGTGIVAAGAGLGLAGWRLGIPALATAAFPVALLALYGSAWGVAFAVKRRGGFALIAAGCYAAALACGGLAGSPAEWLVLSAALFLLVAAPGLVILARARNG